MVKGATGTRCNWIIPNNRSGKKIAKSTKKRKSEDSIDSNHHTFSAAANNNEKLVIDNSISSGRVHSAQSSERDGGKKNTMTVDLLQDLQSNREVLENELKTVSKEVTVVTAQNVDFRLKIKVKQVELDYLQQEKQKLENIYYLKRKEKSLVQIQISQLETKLLETNHEVDSLNLKKSKLEQKLENLKA